MECGTKVAEAAVQKSDGESQDELSPEPSHTDLPDAELRHVTVMFCDLVGSTPLSERLDPETLRSVLREYQSACAKIIRGYDGHIARYFGDGILVYFGYPTAHEDDAQRAVRVGLGVVEAMERLNSRLQQDMQVR
jgi:class 3 adenylate cyclase